AKKDIPPLSKRHSILALSAVELAARIRRQELKSTELVAACIERIKAAAMFEADHIDQLIANRQSDDLFKDKPFLGVPFTAKESHAVLGMLHTLGISTRRATRAGEDAECVRLMRAAGAIPVAVTNVPEINKCARQAKRAGEDAECVRLMRAAGAIPVAVTNVPEINKCARRATRAGEGAECVRLMRAAGAIPVAVTNVPEINKCARRATRAGEGAECVRLMRAAGAIPVAVTNVPEINK
ncbi:Amidase, partial [Operophtera brumata]